jgi:hypothetical protein
MDRRQFVSAVALANIAPALGPQTTPDRLPARADAPADVTRQLARYVVGARAEDLPAAVVKEARRTVVNCSVERPMSDASLEAKFLDLAGGVLPSNRARRLLDQCWTVDSMPRASDLARAAAA